ncbi:MAG: glycosyltransferase [Candidatus Omnitrophica bacterium]|nr:glycosyltransferase [Candidatus Omnitrophota bacterium]
MSFAISLIICSKNRADSLKRCLDAIDGLTVNDANGEVVLVDNGSTDATRMVMESFSSSSPFQVKIVSEPNQGLGRARNAGINVATGEILAFTDDDCYLEKDYLTIVVNSFKKGLFQYCGGRILLYDPSDSPYGCNFQDKFELIPPFSFLPAGKIQGANLSIKRKIVDSIGGFDPDLGAGTRFRCEDIDFCAKASMNGYTGAHLPELVIYHHHRRKPGINIEHLKRENDFARGAYYMKYILQGKNCYLSSWTHSLMSSNFNQSVNEVYGALSYAIFWFHKLISRKIKRQ